MSVTGGYFALAGWQGNTTLSSPASHRALQTKCSQLACCAIIGG